MKYFCFGCKADKEASEYDINKGVRRKTCRKCRAKAVKPRKEELVRGIDYEWDKLEPVRSLL